MIDNLKEKLQGVVVSMPTFCDKDYNLQLDKLRKHIQWLIDHGLVKGSAVLMAAGGLGEGYFLQDDEWRDVVGTLADATQGKVPTMVGVFELSARAAAEKAQYAARAGIDFIQMNPPHYMVPSDDDVFNHYKWVSKRADIGIMAYNTPWAMPKPGYEFTPSILRRLADLQNVVGVKWSSYDPNNFSRCLYMFSNRFSFINNTGWSFSLAYRLGMRGFIDFYANVAPKLSLKFWELIKQRKFDEYEKLYKELRFDPFVATERPEGQAWVGVGEGPTAKLQLKLLGLDAGPAFPAQTSPSQSYVNELKQSIENSGLLEWVEP